MSSPLRRDGRPETDADDRTPVATRAASLGNAGVPARDANTGQGLGTGNLLSFGATPPEPWLAFAPPHPWVPTLRRHAQHAPMLAPPPDHPFRWGAPVFANPFDDPCLALNVPCRPPGEVPFGGYVGGTAATKRGDRGGGEPDVLFPGGGARPVPIPTAVVSESDRDAYGRAPCLPLARQVGLRAAGRGGGEACNFILSPLSFHAAFALVAAGARGETRRELLAFLGSASLDELHRARATALAGTLRDVAPRTASFACGVWVDRRRALTPEFVDVAVSRYASAAEPADFVSEPELARQRVNAFVREATEGLIRDVLPPGSVDSSTVLILANALYFKGTWARPFDPSGTFAAPFHLAVGDVVRAPFMTTSLFREHLVAVFPGFKALKLPYKSDDGAQQAAAFYMLLLLPDGEALEIGDLYDKAVATPGFIRKHTPAEEVAVGRFMVPKFKFTFEFEASEDMKKLGVTRAFDGGDFSGMVAGGVGLSITGVYHKATIEVDELGTVAAAATAVVIGQCLRVGPPPVDFVADRPFVFAIVEERSGVVMFLGHVVNPLAE